MILADVNILIYAFRPDSPDHSRYKTWLEDILNSASTFAMSPQVLAGVVRICTHKRIFAQPSTTQEVFAFCKAILDQPNCAVVIPGERHWAIFENLCDQAKANGNLVQDAWFAALAIESGCEWITTDRDYARFPKLPWRAPF